MLIFSINFACYILSLSRVSACYLCFLYTTQSMFSMAFSRPNPRSYLLNVATFYLDGFWHGQLEWVLASQPTKYSKNNFIYNNINIIYLDI